MLKIEIKNEGNTKLEAAGKGLDILCDSILLVYTMARYFEKHSHTVAEAYKNLLIEHLTADDFWELVASGGKDDDGVEDDIPVQ